MMIEKDFDFGKIFVDVSRGLIFVEKEDGKEEFRGKCGQTEEYDELMNWVQNHPELDYDDKSLLAWKYHICCNCLDMAAEPKEALDFLKVDSPEKQEEVRLEVVGKGRTYILRRMPDVGVVLINPEKLIYLLGQELYWANPEQGWERVKPFDEMDLQFVREVIGTNPARFFA